MLVWYYITCIAVSLPLGPILYYVSVVSLHVFFVRWPLHNLSITVICYYLSLYFCTAGVGINVLKYFFTSRSTQYAAVPLVSSY